MHSSLLIILALTLAEAPPPAPVGRVAPLADGATELILIGDTGEPGPLIARWTAALAKERAPAALVLGDVIYPQAPPCPTGNPGASARELMDRVVARPFIATGKEVFLVLGNHDISWVPLEPPRHLCLIRRFAKDPQVRLPDAYYAVDLGNAILVVFNTNALDDAQAMFARAIVQSHPKKRVLFAGHHVLRTYHDKDDEDRVHPWLVQHGLRPHLWINGHAHILQLVIRDGVVAVTSGTASRPRQKPACDRALGTGECGAEQLWGSSVPGYAVLRIDPDQRLSLTFKDVDGRELWRWAETATPAPQPLSAPAP